jgi:hypothetical protein
VQVQGRQAAQAVLPAGDAPSLTLLPPPCLDHPLSWSQWAPLSAGPAQVQGEQRPLLHLHQLAVGTWVVQGGWVCCPGRQILSWGQASVAGGGAAGDVPRCGLHLESPPLSQW